MAKNRHAHVPPQQPAQAHRPAGAPGAAEELRELVREAHAAAQDLAAATKAARAILEEVPGLVLTTMEDRVNGELATFRETLSKACEEWQKDIHDKHYEFASQFLATDKMPDWMAEVIRLMVRDVARKTSADLVSVFTAEFRRLLGTSTPENDEELIKMLSSALVVMNQGNTPSTISTPVSFFRLAPNGKR